MPHEVDTLRLFCPLQWMKSGYDFRFGSNGKYLGSVNTNWSPNGQCLHNDDDTGVYWKTRAGDMGVAEWNWSWPYPESPFLKNVWFDPFIINEKEVTW